MTYVFVDAGAFYSLHVTLRRKPMGRPKQSTKEKLIKFLLKNPDKTFTYKEIAARFGSHPLAIGQILKSLYRTEHKNLTEQVTHSNPSNKKRRLECIARQQKKNNPIAPVEVSTSGTAIRISEGAWHG